MRFLKLFVAMSIALLVGSLGLAAPAGATSTSARHPVIESASALPTNLAKAATGPAEDKYTTPTVEPLNSVDVNALGLSAPGTLTVGTLSDAPPSICINSPGQFTGFDNELLRAIADKLGLKINFVGTEFSGLLAQVAARRFDVGSSSITTTDARRRTVGFTNGYDFGYFSLVVPSGSPITGFDKLAAGQRIGVVQGTVQEAYVIDTLHLEPVKFPDYNTVYASLKTRQIDAWVAPSQQASGHRAARRSRPDHRKHLQPGQFRRLGRGQGEPAADRRAELRAGRGHRRRHLVAAVLRLGAARVAARLEARVQGGAGTAAAGLHRDRRRASAGTVGGRRAEIDAVATGRLVPGLGSLQAGHPGPVEDRPAEHVDPDRSAPASSDWCSAWRWPSRASPGQRWLRWPARVYTDIFRGLPEVVIILLIGLGVGPVVGGLTGNNPYPLGIAALGLMAAAYIGEIFRSGIQSVEPGQLEASRALGFSYPASMRLVVVPQGVRRVLPALMNQFISLLKASSLVYFLGLVANQRELFQVGRDLNAQTGNLSPLVAAGLFYLTADHSADPSGQLHRHPAAPRAANLVRKIRSSCPRPRR